MIKVLILCAHRPGRSPSQRYRFEQYLPYLRQQGFEFTFSALLNEKDDSIFYSDGNLAAKIFILIKTVFIRLKDVKRFKSYQILFIQREAHFLGTSYFEKKAFRSGAHVIFDFDDSIWLADTSPGNQKWEWIKRPGKFYKNLAYAHTVLAGNNYLLQKALTVNTNSLLVPTTIDTAVHVPMHEMRHKTAVCIGWSGSISTVKHFELLISVLKEIKKEFGSAVSFKVIANNRYSHPELALESVTWTEASEVKELNSLDIGLMPLQDDEWARGKCGLKGLSYMACEIPVIMSHVGVNPEIIESGTNGFLAKNDAEWLQHLRELINNKELRMRLGKKGRETVVEKYSLERHKEQYLQIFRNAQSSR